MCLDQFRDAEVQNLYVAIARDHDVVGLEISVDNAGGVSLR